VAQACADGSPVLFLPGGNARGRCDIPPNFDAAGNYAGVAKRSARINAAERVPGMMRREFTLLRSGRPARVVFELPTDVANEEVGEFDYCRPFCNESG
jgi:thiamine pyrophosphate-dependent acetolactate synthase large subunit-like protein